MFWVSMELLFHLQIQKIVSVFISYLDYFCINILYEKN
jgi:hypothetical protein